MDQPQHRGQNVLTNPSTASICKNTAIKFNTLAERSQFLYFTLTFLLASLGMVFILLFPLLVFVGLRKVDHAIYLVFNSNDWLELAIWLPIIAISTIVSCRIIGIKLPSYSGINVNNRTVPTLVKFVTEIQQIYKLPKFHNIIISDQFILDVVKTPLFGLPLGSTNSLVIGLPVLQTLSPLHFQCALERKLGQYTKRRYFFSNWLYQLRYTWAQYNDVYAERKHSGDQILSWFFKFYSPLYNAASTFTYNKVNLRTDRIALQNMSDIDLLNMIEHTILSKTFLHKIYWPSIREMIVNDPQSSPHPYYRMTQMFHKTLAKCDTQKLLTDALLSENASSCLELSLQKRLDNIGYIRVSKPEIDEITAGVQFLGQAYHSIVGLMDRYWITNRLPLMKLDNDDSANKNSPIYTYGNIANNL